MGTYEGMDYITETMFVFVMRRISYAGRRSSHHRLQYEWLNRSYWIKEEISSILNYHLPFPRYYIHFLAIAYLY
jgi:hypothetical protein